MTLRGTFRPLPRCSLFLPPRDTVLLPFVTTKKEGTGLGLAIVKKIVEAHQGRLLILDNPDKGLTFRIAMPNCAGTQRA